MHRHAMARIALRNLSYCAFSRCAVSQPPLRWPALTGSQMSLAGRPQVSVPSVRTVAAGIAGRFRDGREIRAVHRLPLSDDAARKRLPPGNDRAGGQTRAHLCCQQAVGVVAFLPPRSGESFNGGPPAGRGRSRSSPGPSFAGRTARQASCQRDTPRPTRRRRRIRPRHKRTGTQRRY